MAPTDKFLMEEGTGDTMDEGFAYIQSPKEYLPVRLRHYLYAANMGAFMILAMATSEQVAMVGFIVSTIGLILYNADLTKRRKTLKSLEAL